MRFFFQSAILVICLLLAIASGIQGFVQHSQKHGTVATAATTTTTRQRPNLISLASSLSHDEISRYSRHLVLADVGVKGQEDLKESTVLVIGAGGLGSPALLYLAAAGVGRVGLVDGDVVDASNLQRQIIHGTDTVGTSKCASAAARMRDVNPHVRVRTYEEEFTADTALRILGEGFAPDRPYDVVVDGSDNFPTKYLINDACAMQGVPWVYAAILAFEGQLSVFNYIDGPDYRDLLPTPPPPGEVPSCAEGGVLGVLPGTMGCLQATEVIKILLNKGDICSGRVLVFDALAMKFSQVGLARQEDRPEITELIDYQGFCAGPTAAATSATTTTSSRTASDTTSNGRTMDEVEMEPIESGKDDGGPSFQTIDPQQALDRLVNQGWNPWVLDVRLQTENDIVALPFTDRVAPHRVVRIQDIPADGDVLVYCKAGTRGKKACRRLIENGVDASRLYNLDGGIMQWQQDIDPSMPRY